MRMLSSIVLPFYKWRMIRYIQNAEFKDYPLSWKQYSCAYGQELINYLQQTEYVFRDVLQRSEESGLIDILSIDGISLSKTDLNNYDSIHSFSLFLSVDNAESYIKFQTNEDFIYNCSWIEGNKKIKTVRTQKWNGRKYIINDDGSHHLAAVYRQCREQGRTYQLPLKSEYVCINTEFLRTLLTEYYLVFSQHNNLCKLYKQYGDLFSYDTKEKMALFDLNARNRYPAISKESQLLCLDKRYRVNNFVAERLKSYKSQFFILNDELERLYLKS